MTDPSREAEAQRLLEKITPGKWRVKTEWCDCGGEYGCSHGEFPVGIRTDVPLPNYAERAKRDGTPIPSYAYDRTEIADFSVEDMRFIAQAASLLRYYIEEVQRLRQEIEDAQGIVMDLGAFDPYDQEAKRECFFCLQPEGVPHVEDCPWWLAFRMLMAQPQED